MHESLIKKNTRVKEIKVLMETSEESLRVHADTVESMGTEELSAIHAYEMKPETNKIQILKNVTKIKIM